MGGGSSKSEVSNQTSSWVESFNRTYDQVISASDLGNVTINFPGGGSAPVQTSALQQATPIILGAIGIVGAVMILRS